MDKDNAANSDNLTSNNTEIQSVFAIVILSL